MVCTSIHQISVRVGRPVNTPFVPSSSRFIDLFRKIPTALLSTMISDPEPCKFSPVGDATLYLLFRIFLTFRTFLPSLNKCSDGTGRAAGICAIEDILLELSARGEVFPLHVFPSYLGTVCQNYQRAHLQHCPTP